ncbi:MAG: sulfotransferase domain-containing protein [Candidatus Omnitrophota bacterium]|nr:MAG: sulfotransferase domain-containing protein [Candidatus Omnitrophota bacterium]
MKKVLVTGYIRSGTTLLANFLNSQKGCLVYRDFLGETLISSDKLGIKSFLTELTDRQKNIFLSELKARSCAIGCEAMNGLSKDFSNLKELHERALSALNKKNAYKIVGTKVTRLGEKLTTLIKETDLHVIYIYRDTRDVLLSAKNRFVGFNLIELILGLRKDLKSALSIESKKLLKLKFEDLILNTDSIVKQLADFLDVDISKDIRIAKDRETNWVNNSSFHDIDQLFDKKACFRWKNHRDSKEVKYCEILMGDLIQKIGYDIDMKSYRISDKLSAYKDLYIRRTKEVIKHFYRHVTKG